MELSVFLIVLVAALLHATWNAFVKTDGDQLLFMAVMLAASGLRRPRAGADRRERWCFASHAAAPWAL